MNKSKYDEDQIERLPDETMKMATDSSPNPEDYGENGALPGEEHKGVNILPWWMLGCKFVLYLIMSVYAVT